jgi:hypothetical protein
MLDLCSKYSATACHLFYLAAIVKVFPLGRAEFVKRGPEPHPPWCIGSSAAAGSLAGFAIAALYQIQQVIFSSLSDSPYINVIGYVCVGAAGGALLFASGAAMRNWLKG